MIAILLAPVLLVGQVGIAGSDRPAVAAAPARCPACGADAPALARTIERLQSARLDLARYQAVLALRHYQIDCHPEIVPALIGALRHDREDAVRAEAAISLARLGANRPDVRSALRQAAATDRWTVRLRANWSLNHLDPHGGR